MASTRNRATRIPALTRANPSTLGALAQSVEAMREALEVRLGRRGDALDAAVTYRDLVDAGIAGVKRTALGNELIVDPGEITLPGYEAVPEVTGFAAASVFGGIVLRWDYPDGYGELAYAELYRGTSADPTQRQLLATVVGNLYTDRVEPNDPTTYYYWVRFVSTGGKKSSFAGPVSATATPLVETIIEEISGRVNEEVLDPAFKDRLDGFSETISELGDRYTVTLNNNGHVTGYTMYNTGKWSSFAVLADNFTIANSLGQRRQPFIVQDNTVYIDSAMIRRASIQEGQLGSISFGKIKDASGRSLVVVGGKLQAESIETNNLDVRSAARFSGDVYSSNYIAGQRGWAIRQSGTLEIGSGGLADSVSLGGDSVRTIRERAYAGSQAGQALDNWTRPNTTLIDGNKIYTGDAYVDTLQIKGDAVMVPLAATGTTGAQVGVSITAADVAATGSVRVVCIATVTKGDGSNGSTEVSIQVDGAKIATERPVKLSVSAMAGMTYLSQGYHTIRVHQDDTEGDVRCSITVLAAKR